MEVAQIMGTYIKHFENFQKHPKTQIENLHLIMDDNVMQIA